MPDPATELPAPSIESRILLIRGAKVLLDRDLAALYRVRPIALRQQVRRNPKRFPADFLFELEEDEIAALLSQNVIPSRRTLGGAKPLAFTEQGIAMLSSVLTSERAIEVNIAIMRTFVKLRQLLATHEELAHRLDQLEWRQSEQEGRVHYVFETIQHLIEAPAHPEPKRRIGFPTASDSRSSE
ncbi:MAG TPA: ORF6N domain-containing protein [Bryobacteraceae bacterium]|jgi:ORF6N domain